MSQEEAVRSLLLLGQVGLSARDYESAIEAYASVLKLEPNETAAYNLGSLYARGLGVRQDFAEAALRGGRPMCTLEEGLRSLQIIHGAYLSHWLRRAVAVPVDEEDYRRRLSAL